VYTRRRIHNAAEFIDYKKEFLFNLKPDPNLNPKLPPAALTSFKPKA